MADCKVILECCGGQTECNQKVTIGYLKTFIMSGTTYLLKTTAGTDVHVNSSNPDAYEPTYDELMSGSILPLYVDGGNNKGASSIDGIIIEGSHTSSETIRRIDLSLAYTKFKSLSISAGKTTFDSCGDSTTMQYVYTLTKTVKSVSSCEPFEYSYSQTDVYDTSNISPNNVTFAAGCDWITINGTSLSAEKNGTGNSSSRTCIITATLTYKGNTEASINSETISQDSVGGNWVQYETTYDGVSVDVYGSDEYDCNGGSFSIDVTGQYTKYYYWVDDCGNEYRNVTSSTTHSEFAGSDSGSFPNCPDATNQTKTLSVTWHNITGSHTFSQVCTCDSCTSSREYGQCSDNSQTIGSCGGDVIVSCNMPITTHTRTWVDGVCVDTTGTTSETQSATVSIAPNETQSAKTYTGSVVTEEGGTINYTISQEAGPCGGCTGETQEYIYPSVVSTSIGACETSATVTIPYTAITNYDNCSSIESYYEDTANYTVPKNETTASTSYTRTYDGLGGNSVTVNIYQSAGPCTCLCSMLTVTPTTHIWTYDRTDSHDITVSSAVCTTGISVNTLTHFNAAIVSDKITVSPKGINMSGVDYTETLIISYKADETNCSSSVTLTQTAQEDPCIGKQCNELTVTEVITSFGISAYTDTNIISFDASDCVSNISVSSNSNWLTVYVDEGTNKVKGSLEGQDCETSERNATITLSWEVNGNSCSTAYTITQQGDSTVCPCSTYEYSGWTTPSGSGAVLIDKCGGSGNTVNLYLKRRCTSTTPYGEWEDYPKYYKVSKIGSSGYQFQHFDNESTVIFYADSNESERRNQGYRVFFYEDLTKTKTVAQTADIGVYQPSGCTSCTCNSIGIPYLVTTNIPSTGNTKFVVWRIGTNNCINEIKATSGNCDSLFSSVGTGISGSYYVVSASVSPNSSGYDKQCTIGYELYAKDVASMCSTNEATVTISKCDCDSAESDLGSYSTSTIPSTGGTGYYIPYTANCGTVTATVDNNSWAHITNVDTANERIYFSVDNNSGNDRTNGITLYVNGEPCVNKTFTQSSFTCDCNSANAKLDGPKLGGSNVNTIPASGGTNYYMAYSADCGNENVTAWVDYDWANIDSVDTVNHKIYFSVSANTSSDSRDNYVNLNINNPSSGGTNYCKYKKFTQDGFVCDCNESELTVTTTTKYYTASSGAGTIHYTKECGTVTASTSDSWIDITDNSGGYISFNVSANTDTTMSRTGTVRVYLSGYSLTCGYDVNIIQSAAQCTCGNADLTVNTTGMTVGSGSSSSNYITYSNTCGSINAVVTSGDTWITIGNKTSSRIYFSVASNSGSERRGTVRVYLDGYSGSCYQDVVIVQESGITPCQCSDFEITEAPYSSSCAPNSGGTNILIARYTGNCTGISAITSNAAWITSDASQRGDGYIYANISANCSSDRTATLTVHRSLNGSTCPIKSITVKQCKGGYSGITASPSQSQITCSGGTVTFTANPR